MESNWYDKYSLEERIDLYKLDHIIYNKKSMDRYGFAAYWGKSETEYMDDGITDPDLISTMKKPLEDMPLHINDKYVGCVASWRLLNGK